jgi:hypothetical protein
LCWYAFSFVVIEKRILHNRSIHAIFGEGIDGYIHI